MDRLQDVLSVMCGDGSVPESIVGRRLMDIDSSVLYPRSEKADEKERVLQAVCGVLASLIVITLSKLLYDYWNYTKRGKLPWTATGCLSNGYEAHYGRRNVGQFEKSPHI